MCVAGVHEERPAAGSALAAAAFRRGRLDLEGTPPASDSSACLVLSVARAGVAVGPLVAGVIGSRCSYDAWGDTANTAHRMAYYTEANTARCTRATRDLIADGPFSFPWSGTAFVKGKGLLEVFTLAGAEPLPPRGARPDREDRYPPSRDEEEEEEGGPVPVRPGRSLAARLLWKALGYMGVSPLNGAPSMLRLAFASAEAEMAFWERRRAASLGALRQALLLGLCHALAWPLLWLGARYPPAELRRCLVLRYLLQGSPAAAAALLALLYPHTALQHARALVLVPSLATAVYLGLQLAWLGADDSSEFPNPGQAASVHVADLQFFSYYFHMMPGPIVPFLHRLPWDAALVALYAGGQHRRVGAAAEGAHELLIHLLVLALPIMPTPWVKPMAFRRAPLGPPVSPGAC
eukprot:tig00021339_g20380.t1